MPDKTYLVNGMTCGHCEAAVSGEIGKVPGVQAVNVELDSGRVTVTGDGYTDDQIAAAVDEAGYELASAQAS